MFTLLDSLCLPNSDRGKSLSSAALFEIAFVNGLVQEGQRDETKAQDPCRDSNDEEEQDVGIAGVIIPEETQSQGKYRGGNDREKQSHSQSLFVIRKAADGRP